MSSERECIVCQQGWGGTHIVKQKQADDVCPECATVDEADGQQELPLDGLDAVKLADGGIVVIDGDTQWYEELD